MNSTPDNKGTNSTAQQNENKTVQNYFQNYPYQYPYYYNPYGYYYGYNVAQPFYMPTPAYYPTQPSSTNYLQPPLYPPMASSAPSLQRPTLPLPLPASLTAATTTNVQTNIVNQRAQFAPVNPFASLSIKKNSVQLDKIPHIFKNNSNYSTKNNESVEMSKHLVKEAPKKEIPQSLKDFVARSFKNCRSEEDKDVLSVQIKDFLKNCVEDGSAFTKSWQNMSPLRACSIQNTISIDSTKKLERQQRFVADKAIPTRLEPITSVNPPFIFPQNKSSDHITAIVGSSTTLEKSYLRLTTEPDPTLIRPVEILRKSYEHVIKKWAQTQNYHYVCEQFKSIRQDLTIQGIRNEFTVKVYEENARISLKMSDREEFNQCQTCLKQLYREGIKGNEIEFIIYNILYLIYTSNHIELANLISTLTPDIENECHVKLALKLYSAFCDVNFVKFFQIYEKIDMPYAKALIDMFIDRLRLIAFKTIISAYLPNISQTFIATSLSFKDTNQLHEWLTNQNIPFHTNEDLDCKSVRIHLNSLT
ncbi:hypothetical protein HZS_2581, partial [Henneguya salminicola]